jgi:hypothetical protein
MNDVIEITRSQADQYSHPVHSYLPSLLDIGLFEDEVRKALKNYTNPEEFVTSPLLNCHCVTERAGGSVRVLDRTLALQHLLYDTISALNRHPKRARAYRALKMTFLTPAHTQEKAAELLDLPFSTYRRHLKEGIAYVTRTLWHREMGQIFH